MWCPAVAIQIPCKLHWMHCPAHKLIVYMHTPTVSQHALSIAHTHLDNRFSHFLYLDKILTCPAADTRTFSSSSSAFQRGSVWTRLYTLTRLRLKNEPALQQIWDKQKRRRRLKDECEDEEEEEEEGSGPTESQTRCARLTGFGIWTTSDALWELCWRVRERRERGTCAHRQRHARARTAGQIWRRPLIISSSCSTAVGKLVLEMSDRAQNASLELAQKSFF